MYFSSYLSKYSPTAGFAIADGSESPADPLATRNKFLFDGINQSPRHLPSQSQPYPHHHPAQPHSRCHPDSVWSAFGPFCCPKSKSDPKCSGRRTQTHKQTQTEKQPQSQSFLMSRPQKQKGRSKKVGCWGRKSELQTGIHLKKSQLPATGIG